MNSNRIKNAFSRAGQWGWRRPRWVLAGAGVVTVVLAIGVGQLSIESSVEEALPEDSPPRLADAKLREIFDMRDLVLVGVVHPSDAFNDETIAKIDRMATEIRQLRLTDDRVPARLVAAVRHVNPSLADHILAVIHDIGLPAAWLELRPQVEDAITEGEAGGRIAGIVEEIDVRLHPVDDVVSITSVDAISGDETTLDIGPPIGGDLRDSQTRHRIKRRVLADRTLAGSLVSKDASTLALLVKLSFNPVEMPQVMTALTRALEEIRDAHKGPEAIFISGIPVVNSLLNLMMSKDLSVLTPASFVLLALVLLAFLRRPGITTFPLIVVVMTLTWTLGLMGFAGRSITIITTAMPVILLAVSVAASIHFLARYGASRRGGDDAVQATWRSLREMTRPILMASLTTSAGFSSLAVAPLPSIRDFGMFTAVGVICSLVITLWVLPALLVLTRATAASNQTKKHRGIETFAVQAGLALSRHRVVTGVSAAVLALLSILAIPHLEVGSVMTGNFRKKSEIYRAGEVLNTKLGGTQILNVVLDTHEDAGAKDPAVLAWIQGLQRYLESEKSVGLTFSLADLVQRMNFVIHSEDPPFDRLPEAVEMVRDPDGGTAAVDGREQIDQYVFLYEGGGGEGLEELVDFDYRQLRVIVQIRGDDHAMSRAAKQQALAYMDAHPPPGDIWFAGCAETCIFADDLIIPSQTRSLFVAIIVCGVLMGLLLRPRRFAVAGVLPMTLIILVTFGIMWLMSIRLDSITALFGSIVLGIGVDYAIHILAAYDRNRRNGGTHVQALVNTLLQTARPIILNALAVGAGFSILLISSFYPVKIIGGLVTGTLLLGTAFSLLLLPPLLDSALCQSAYIRPKGKTV